MDLQIQRLTGDGLQRHLDDVARLRIAVFAEYPYLYDGDLKYEADYLGKFAALDGAIIVAALDGDEVVGAATGSPLAHQFDEFSKPLADAGHDISEIFYCGESVLLPAHRGKGIGHKFFDEREAQARRLGLSKSCFLSVIRGGDHPLRPDGYRPLDGFWRKRGYEPVDGLTATFDWREHPRPGEAKDASSRAEEPHELQYWMRVL